MPLLDDIEEIERKRAQKAAKKAGVAAGAEEKEEAPKRKRDAPLDLGSIL